MSETRGIFVLADVVDNSLDGEWVSLNDVWTSRGTSNRGYFGGGFFNPGSLSSMEKVDYLTDTTDAVPGAPLNAARYRLAATGNSDTGYFGGGGPGFFSSIDKITYSTDSVSPTPGVTLSVPCYRLAATGNSTAGYFALSRYYSGYSSGTLSSIDKITYSTNTRQTLPSAGTLSIARESSAATGNSAAGYFIGGQLSPSKFSTIDKLNYSTDSMETLPASGSLSTERYLLAATGNSAAGYLGGGYYLQRVSTIDRITYSTNTRDTLPASGSLSVIRYGLAATGNSAAGYFGGGWGGSPCTIMDKINYSTDTRESTPNANLITKRGELAASSARANALQSIDTELTNRFSDGNLSGLNTGYFAGGTPGHSTIDKLNYSTDTRESTPGLTLSASAQPYRNSHSATGNSTDGYFGGGNTGGTSSSIDKLTYSSDTTGLLPASGVLSGARYGGGATGNSAAGYFGGGQEPSSTFRSTIDKLTYSNDTRVASPGVNLSIARGLGFGGTGNQTEGYFGGGRTTGTPSRISTIDKLTYSTDTLQPLPASGTLSAVRSYTTAATGNSAAGYFGGGTNDALSPVTSIDKLTYSTDTREATPGVSLPFITRSGTATGNSVAGYFAGGFPGSRTTIDKIDYSTDTLGPLPSAGTLSFSRWNLAATSAKGNGLPQPIAATPTATTSTITVPNTGYFGGGKGSGFYIAAIYKLNYSDDTRSTGSGLSATRYGAAATGNSTAGYFGGGRTNISYVSVVDKLTYSTDTTEPLSNTTLSAARGYIGATGNSTHGYFGGGSPGAGVVSTMDKITYSNDSNSIVPNAVLSVNRLWMGATGNSTAGYFGGGFNPGGSYSTMDKLTYSTDTTGSLPSTGALSGARYGAAATGNSTEGYFAGGHPGYVTTIDKLTYSTDTRAATPGVTLNVGRYHLAATGNSTTGYFGGGVVPAFPGYTSTMDKLTYSTSTTDTLPSSGSLGNLIAHIGATSARANGLSQPTAAVANSI